MQLRLLLLRVSTFSFCLARSIASQPVIQKLTCTITAAIILAESMAFRSYPCSFNSQGLKNGKHLQLVVNLNLVSAATKTCKFTIYIATAGAAQLGCPSHLPEVGRVGQEGRVGQVGPSSLVEISDWSRLEGPKRSQASG